MANSMNEMNKMFKEHFTKDKLKEMWKQDNPDLYYQGPDVPHPAAPKGQIAQAAEQMDAAKKAMQTVSQMTDEQAKQLMQALGASPSQFEAIQAVEEFQKQQMYQQLLQQEQAKQQMQQAAQAQLKANFDWQMFDAIAKQGGMGGLCGQAPIPQKKNPFKEKYEANFKPDKHACPSCKKKMHYDERENVWWCNKRDCDFPWVVDNVMLHDYPDPSDERTHLGTILEYYDLSMEDTYDEVSEVS
jgi:ribosomal protein L37AE/L43A